MAKIAHAVTSVFVALAAVACGSGDVVPNGVEPIDCTQDDAYVIRPITGALGLSTQDQTFRKKMSGQPNAALDPEGAFVSKVQLANPRCPPEGDDTATRIWTVSSYTRWGHSVSVAGAAIGVDGAQYEGISFWAKALVGASQAELAGITLLDPHFTTPQMKVDPVDPNIMTVESQKELEARLPKPVTSTGVMRLTVATTDTQSGERCAVPPNNTPPPLQVQDGSDECYDSFTTAFYPPEQWKFFTFPFVELRQSGWGKPANFLNTTEIGAVEFTVGPFADYDLLIAGVGYYNRATAP